MGLTRLRLGVLAAAFVVLGTSAGGIFDRFVWILAIVPLLPIGLVTLTVARRGVVRRIGAAIVGILAATAVAVFVVGGDASDIVTAFTSGVRRLLSTEWPSPYRPPLVGVVAAGLAIGASLSAIAASCAALEPAAARAGGAHLPRRDRPVGAARDPAVDTHHRLHPLGDVRRAPRRGAGAARSVALPPRRAAALRARRHRRAASPAW